MDFRCPWGRFFLTSGTTYRVLTCNLHYGECDPVTLRALIRRENPDFIALQECKYEYIQTAVEGYQVVRSGLLLVASRFPLHEEGNASGLEPLHANPRTHVLLCSADTPKGKLLFGSVHLPSPRYGLSSVLDRNTGIQPSKKDLLEEHIRLRREESATIAALVKKLPGPVILAGDFNTPVESAIYHTNWSSYRNAFSQTGFGFGRTFRADVHGIPFGVRIDHILGGPEIVPSRCWVGPTIGSEHLPVLADMIRE
jgi:vancomycin resistance protein VanJ